MKQKTRISKLSLSVVALGLSAFSIDGFVSTAYAADNPASPETPKAAHTAPAHAEAQPLIVKSEDVDAQANNLRSLFEAAGRSGLVNLRNPDGSPDAENPARGAASIERTASKTVADCMTLSPLFDGGQGGFATGMFTELKTDWPENAVLAETLSELIDPGYDGRTLPLDLSSASDCGSSFLPWQALADPGHVLGAEDEGALTSALAQMEPALRRQLGVQIATRAGLAGNMRLTRRVSDTLIDADLHGKSHHNRDPEHILLDSILRMSRDPIGARARLSWIAERDGPEQLIAIDLMRQLDAAPAVYSELRRLADSPDHEVRFSAEQRLLANAIEDFDIDLVAELVTTTNNLAGDEQSRARLAIRLAEAIDSDDVLKAIQALNVIDRLEVKGVKFTPELKAKAEVRTSQIATNTRSVGAADFTSSLPRATAPAQLSGPELVDYLGTLETEMDAYQEVLSRG